MTTNPALEALRLRPRFRYKVHNSADVTLKTLRFSFDNAAYRYKGQFLGENIVIGVSEKDEHYWSPVVSIQILQHNEGSLIKGLFGPKPDVWTFFALMRLAMITLAVFLGVIGMSQYMLDHEPWALWGLLGIGVLAVLVWLLGRSGRLKARSQVDMLKDFIVNSLSELDPDLTED